MHFRTLILGSAAALALTTQAPAQTTYDTYQQQLDQYHSQQDEYQDQRRAYEDRMYRYEYERSHPAYWWRSAYFHAAPEYYYRDRDPVGIDVDERDGFRVGRIGAVERAPDGRVDRVEIVLNGDRAAWVDAFHIRYDRIDRIAFVDLPRGELYDRSHDLGYDYRP
ncbi:MAG: hypothetical protein JOZ55_00790 [Alphaproteobacteria bacterium]|nr:hypothetical protein [Alphaproteobacteria bacterium]